MRDVKFRAWDSEKKQMARVSMLGEEEAHLYKVTGETWVSPKHYVAVIMQYTGLKDKNGVEIYEGDILMAGDAYLGVIEYHSTRAQFIGKNIGETFPEDEYDTLYTKNGRFNSAKVIGNIYENPVLLEREGK